MKPNHLSSIAINEMELSCQQRPTDTKNIHFILSEIKHRLKQFYLHAQNHIIDLGAIPLTASERLKLLKLLGHGEVKIHLSSLGESEIYETLFSAVWVVRHKDEQGQINALFIEICRIPDIVTSQAGDIKELTTGLQELIDNLKG